MRPAQKRSARRGFSLIEVAVATSIVGLSLAALLVATASNTRINSEGSKMLRAAYLAQEMREWTLLLPFQDPDEGDRDNPPGPDGTSPLSFVDDLDDLMDVTFTPPRDGQGYSMYGMDGWSQTVAITWHDPMDLSTEAAAGSTDLVRVQVDVVYRNQTVLTTSWLVTRRSDE